MPRSRRFGISTHLFHGQRLQREHLREIGAAGFDSVELFATRTHLDYHNESTTADLQQWLAEAGLELVSVHAPVADSYSAGRWGALWNLASPDESRRQRAVDEATRALQLARRLPFQLLVVHAGVLRSQAQAPGENSRDAARRSVESLAVAARPLGVTVAVEVITNDLSKPAPLAHFVEDVLEPGTAAICLDLGHARLDGDLVDAIETVSEHIALVHASDNRGRHDDHLVPFDGTIDWPAAITGLQKVGYDGPIVFELSAQGSTRDTLTRARTARDRIDRMLNAF